MPQNQNLEQALASSHLDSGNDRERRLFSSLTVPCAVQELNLSRHTRICPFCREQRQDRIDP